jgi:hypothetical protein
MERQNKLIYSKQKRHLIKLVMNIMYMASDS